MPKQRHKYLSLFFIIQAPVSHWRDQAKRPDDGCGVMQKVSENTQKGSSVVPTPWTAPQVTVLMSQGTGTHGIATSSLPGWGLCEERLGVQHHSRFACHCCLVAQSCPTLCDPMNYSPPGSSALGIFQESILEWVAIPFSRGSSQTMDRTQVSCIAGRFFTIWDNREGVSYSSRFYWAFSWIRHCPFEWLYFIPTISKKWILLFPFYRWENWGSAIRCRT